MKSPSPPVSRGNRVENAVCRASRGRAFVLSATMTLGCSSEAFDEVGQVRSWEGAELISDSTEPACTTLSEAARTVTIDLFGVPDGDFYRRGTVAALGLFELTHWRRWYSSALTAEEGEECRELSFPVHAAATPRKQSLRITRTVAGEPFIEIRTDFLEPSETAELSFLARYDAAQGAYVPNDLSAVCARDTTSKHREVWYLESVLSNSGARLVEVEEGLLAVIPFRSNAGCAVVEYYARVTM